MVPAALKGRGALARLVTDLWIGPNHPLGMIAPRLRDRFLGELDGAVIAFNGPALALEAQGWLAGASGWRSMMRRNEWFQAQAHSWLARNLRGGSVVLSYSYAARRLFELAKGRGAKTVLVQIDPGPLEERLVEDLHRMHPGVEQGWHPAPPEYWKRWREEIALSDHVVVHSEWSRAALAGVGVPQEKLSVIPLAYEPPVTSHSFERRYPDRFTEERPLRALFLGQVILRKGVMPLLEAARQLRNEPIEFNVIGPGQINAELGRAGRVRWHGALPRGQTHLAFREADVFLFPTFSDGFGLTQLEAQAWRLPVITTACCGEVVRDGVNGIMLQETSANEIVSVLRNLLQEPGKLASMSAASGVDERHRPDAFARSLLGIESAQVHER